MKNFKHDDSFDTKISDSDLEKIDVDQVNGWPKDESEVEVQVLYTTRKDSDRFSAPYQNGVAHGGGDYVEADEIRVMLEDEDLTENLTEKCLDRIREKINEKLGDQ